MRRYAGGFVLSKWATSLCRCRCARNPRAPVSQNSTACTGHDDCGSSHRQVGDVLTDPRSALPGSVDMLGPIARVRELVTL
jgi:hypothetical protein